MKALYSRLMIGPAVMVVAVSVYRSMALAREISSDWIGLFAGLLLSDGVSIGLVLALSVLAGLKVPRVFRWPAAGLAVAIAFAHILDAFIVMSLDQRLSIPDLRQYLPETDVVASFLTPARLALLGAFLLGTAVHIRVRRRTLSLTLAAAVLVMVAGIAAQSRFPEAIRRYTTPVVALLAPGSLTDTDHFTYAASDLPHYLAEYRAHQQAEPLPGHPNMILVIMESLSSINSRRIAGVRDWLPQFDALSHEGTLFVNFFANHAASEGGIISLISGFPPINYPTARPLMFEEFGMQLPVLRSLQAQGYYTVLLTTTRLDFINMDEYLRGVGFDETLGRDEVPTFAAAPRYAEDAPSDDLLYAQALERLDRLERQSPFLLVLVTASSHLPYTHPDGGADEAPAVWAWVQQKLLEFHQALSERGFYEDGMLLITGDHRQMRPLTDAERERYGESAKARVPLLIIGDGIARDRVDQRFFQQSDLFRRLGLIGDPESVLSPNPLWVKRYNRKFGKIGRTGHLTVFAEADGSDGARGYELYVSGNTAEWLGERPPGARQVEILVHAQRAAHQAVRNRAHAPCLAEWRSPPGDGLTLSAYADVAGLDGPPLRRTPLADPGLPDLSLPTGAVLVYSGTLEIPESGAYWFGLETAGPGACLRLDGETAIPPGANPGDMVQAELQAGPHAFALRAPTGGERLYWLPPGARRSQWGPVPAENFRADSDRR